MIQTAIRTPAVMNATLLTEVDGYHKAELEKMFGVKSNIVPAINLIMENVEEYRRRRKAALAMGLVGC